MDSFKLKAGLEQAAIDNTLRAKLLDREEGDEDNLLYYKVEEKDIDSVKAILEVAGTNGLLKELMLDKGTDGDTVLNKALITNDSGVIKAIFEKLFTIGDLSILQEVLVLNNDYEVSPLHNFVFVAPEIIQEVLALAGNNKVALEAFLGTQDAEEQTALHFAAYEGNIEGFTKGCIISRKR